VSATPTPAAANALHAALREGFGYEEFRPLQEEAVAAAVAGRDVLVVMPTGAGKSLCYQLPSLLTPGLTLVVSPLIALMKDQVDALNARPAFQRIGCACLNSSLTTAEQEETLCGVADGSTRLLYVAPERFRSREFLAVVTRRGVARFVVDEAHCISEWGHDFRPDYLTLRPVLDALGSPPLLAATATATDRVRASIAANLGMRDPLALVGGFNRPNLHYSAIRCAKNKERLEKLARALPKLAALGGSGLIYAPTRKLCEEIAATAAAVLSRSGLSAGAYHAGLSPDERNRAQAAWIDGSLHLLVATNAFGMGIDKPDVRYVVHCGYPESLENYYQEAGRAGRDGLRSRCAILYTTGDLQTRRWFIENEALSLPELIQAHAEVVRRAQSDTLRVFRSWWAGQFDGSDVRARLALGYLERAGLLTQLSETREEMVLRIDRREVAPDAATRMSGEIERLRAERYRRLKEMVGYCKTTACRRRAVLRYFGDRDEPHLTGGCCDNCDAAAKPQAQAVVRDRSDNAPAPRPAPAEALDLHGILEQIDAMRPALGLSRLNKVLRGSDSVRIEEQRRRGSRLLGCFPDCSRDQVNGFLRALIDRGLLAIEGEGIYAVCRVTPVGRAAYQERTAVDVPLPSLVEAPDEHAAPDHHALYEALRAWRKEQARVEDLPLYCVISDRALREIAAAPPSDKEGLRRVHGVGPVKVNRYGEEIMRLVRTSAEECALTRAEARIVGQGD
jgi:ATP-dependent DNA helicase RecQ